MMLCTCDKRGRRISLEQASGVSMLPLKRFRNRNRCKRKNVIDPKKIRLTETVHGAG